MKKIVASLFENYADDIVFLMFIYIGSMTDFASVFLSENGWRANDFFVGVFGQGIFILLMYFLDRGPKFKSKTEKVTKGVLGIFLGGITAMIAAPYIPVHNSLVTLLLGFSFQLVWERWLIGLINKLIPDNDNKVNLKDDGGTPTGTGG